MKDKPLAKSMQAYVFDEYKLSLSTSTTFFAKHFVSMASEFMKLSTPFTHQHVIKTLIQVFQLFMDHIEACLRSEKFEEGIQIHSQEHEFPAGSRIEAGGQRVHGKDGQQVQGAGVHEERL